MNEFLQEFSSWLDEISGGNQMIAGAISLWLMTIASYVCRNIPLKIWNFTKKHTTTNLTITNQHKSFYSILEWLEANGHSDRFRNIKLTNGRFGFETKTTKSVGYGTHLIWHRGRPILISLVKEDATATEREKEYITLSKLGRSHKILDELVEQVNKVTDDARSTEVYAFGKDYWCYSGRQPKRSFDSILIPDDVLKEILTTLDNFNSSEQWYIKHGIPYQLGILLYGPPGTGKTSIVKGIASYLDKKLSVVPGGSLAHINNMIMGLPENSVFLIEDIDADSTTHSRVDNSNKDGDLLDELQEMKSCNLSTILNAMDGIMSKHGRVMITTTNHIEKLDPALIRPGRIDLKIEIGYINEETFYKFMKRFFGSVPDQFKLLRNDLTGAELQKDVLNQKSWQDIYSKYTSLGESNG